jgi:hypothetical protein
MLLEISVRDFGRDVFVGAALPMRFPYLLEIARYGYGYGPGG